MAYGAKWCQKWSNSADWWQMLSSCGVGGVSAGSSWRTGNPLHTGADGVRGEMVSKTEQFRGLVANVEQLGSRRGDRGEFVENRESASHRCRWRTDEIVSKTEQFRGLVANFEQLWSRRGVRGESAGSPRGVRGEPGVRFTPVQMAYASKWCQKRSSSADRWQMLSSS
jgi:hypothetical protein